jgi:hypothetical protein
VHGDGKGACAYGRVCAPQACISGCATGSVRACGLYDPVFARLGDRHTRTVRVVIHGNGILFKRSIDRAGGSCASRKDLWRTTMCVLCCKCRTLFQRAGGLAAANKQLALLDAFVPFWLTLGLTKALLSHNRISELPDSFAGLASLEELRLSNNLLATFPAPVRARKHTRMNRCARAGTEHACIGAAPQRDPQ